ncbi:MAG: ATP synthase F1 subunit delta [Muribaculaceae bacterium]|nr:ATP synthase F1 subunit delta [Muribaculaceae bacterium]
MNEGLIPKRYAKALFEFASEKGDAQRLYALMKNIDAAFASASGIQKALANPYIAPADKKQLLSTAAAAGNDTVFADFLSLLEHNRRLDMARPIALAYMDIFRKANGIKVVKVQSAAPLDAASEAKLKDLIAAHIGGNSMEYTSSVNPDLIGGFTVQTGNERLDASVANELKQLRLNLISK